MAVAWSVTRVEALVSMSPRSLDLTGPLLLGGVPDLPEDFPVHNRHFVGCMRDLAVDGQRVDMASFIANNGTRAGAWIYSRLCSPLPVWTWSGPWRSGVVVVPACELGTCCGDFRIFQKILFI